MTILAQLSPRPVLITGTTTIDILTDFDQVVDAPGWTKLGYFYRPAPGRWAFTELSAANTVPRVSDGAEIITQKPGWLLAEFDGEQRFACRAQAPIGTTVVILAIPC